MNYLLYKLVLYYMDIDDIPVVFLFLNFDFFVTCVKILFLSFTYEAIDVVMVTEIKLSSFIITDLVNLTLLTENCIFFLCVLLKWLSY